ncbi:MAG: hypothetical protein ABI177_07885 [Edaphobacter sp.]
MRIGLWFGCLLLAVGLFSVLFIRFYGASGEVMFIVRVTMMFALPVWLLYLPIIFKLRDAEDNRIWIILGSGILIGPLALTIWCLILQLFGGDAHAIWRGDDLAPSTVACMIFASVVGFMATLPYGIVLKIFHHQSAVATGKVT